MVSRTAAYVAMYRALETLEPKPVIRDPYAIRFLPRELAMAVRASRVAPVRKLLLRYADHRAPGARTSAIARTAAIDELVYQLVFSGLCRQVVLLGAGFDARAHRLPELAGVPVFEVDRRETQASKRAHVPASKVTYVEVDFLRDDAFAKLEAAGWKRDQASLIIWEGVTNYLTEAAVLRVLSEVGRCAAGTRIVFTYIHRGVLDGSHAFVGGEQIRANVAKLGEPWTFGLEPSAVGDFVARAGLVLRRDHGADEYRREWLGKTSPGYAFYRLAVAERTDHDAIHQCDECESSYVAATSRMSALCPECSHILYGYPNCEHAFVDGRCTKCGWNGARSAYIRRLLER